MIRFSVYFLLFKGWLKKHPEMKAFFAEQFSKYQELEAKVKSNEWHDPDCEANKQTMAQIYELTRDLANFARY